MPASIELEFGDGTYLFALKIPQILELQRVCGWADAKGNKRETGIFTIYGRVLKGRYVLQETDLTFGMPHECEAHLSDVIETIRLGLIGGGRGMVNKQEVSVSQLRARELVDTYCFPAVPLKESWDIAAAILTAVVEGYEAQKKSPEPEPEPSRPKTSTRRRSSPTAR